MAEFSFTKMHGLGNDFVMVDCLQGQLSDADLPKLALQTCDRHFGIGADGLVRILTSQVADYRMQIWNPDGSEAEMCGNASRCFGKYLFDRKMCVDRVSAETLAGIKVIDIESEGGIATNMVVNLEQPKLDAADIPIIGFTGRVISQPLMVGDTEYRITPVSVGNPHCVIFVDSVDDVDLEKVGPMVETHPAFPTKVNVEFAQVIKRDEAKMRVWERAAGVTLACGTGTCATLVAGVLNGLLDRKATVHLPGGDLIIEWREDGDLYMIGPATEVFTGTFRY
jgi:diaminopimelate epimerase